MTCFICKWWQEIRTRTFNACFLGCCHFASMQILNTDCNYEISLTLFQFSVAFSEQTLWKCRILVRLPCICVQRLLTKSAHERTAFMFSAQTLVLDLERCFLYLLPWIVMALSVYLNLESQGVRPQTQTLLKAVNIRLEGSLLVRCLKMIS